MPLDRTPGQSTDARVGREDGRCGPLHLVRGRLPVALILLSSLVAPASLAYATPPDPVWLPGTYDAADHDDVVGILTGTAMAEGCAFPATVRPLPIALWPTALPAVSALPLVILPVSRPRPPPIS